MDRSFRPPKPTVNQTATRYGLAAADLGHSFEHDGKAFFLFGDAAPPRAFHGKHNGTACHRDYRKITTPSGSPRTRSLGTA
jgi:hypothetical protein